jgi:predicted nucleic acid-binding protein
VQRRPVRPCQDGYLHHVGAIQDRANRVQPLLDNRQDNQCQSRPPQPDAPRKTSPPPVSGNPSADCVGTIVDAAEFSLCLSPHILVSTERVLAELFKWDSADTDAYVAALVSAADDSGGGIVTDVPRTVHDCPDHEDNLVLDLSAEVGALIVVSNDTDLLSMSPWRGTPIIDPRSFAARVHAMRRHARRPRR